jgi:hypothetical protein
MFTHTPLYLALFVVALVVFTKLCDWLKDKLVYKGDSYGREIGQFTKDARARGLTFTQTQDALYIREMMARFRCLASDAVRYDPSNWLVLIDAEKKASIAYVAAQRPDLAPTFARTISTLSYGHVLYPTEAHMVDSLVMGRSAPLMPTDHQRAALRIVKAG